MRRTFACGLILAIIFVFASIGFAQKAGRNTETRPGFVNVNVVKIKASVEDIGQDRTITLKGPEGNFLTIRAGDEVRNFDQIKIGDNVVVRYYECVAVLVDKARGDQPQASETDIVQVAPKGAKPAAVKVNIRDLTATVDKINYKKRTITLKVPEGDLLNFKVDSSVKNFKKVKKGDEIYIRHTEALAVSVEKP
ncbi:MAG: hypothetical protein ABFD62_11645 [Syntrophaceae bacterium]